VFFYRSEVLSIRLIVFQLYHHLFTFKGHIFPGFKKVNHFLGNVFNQKITNHFLFFLINFPIFFIYLLLLILHFFSQLCVVGFQLLLIVVFILIQCFRI